MPEGKHANPRERTMHGGAAEPALAPTQEPAGHDPAGDAALPGNRTAVYDRLFGRVPAKVLERWKVQEQVGRGDMIDAVEAVRRVAIAENPLGLKVQQLVQFGQLAVLGHGEAALLHARSALRAGATFEEIAGVAETALITAGVPGYSLGLHTLEILLKE